MHGWEKHSSLQLLAHLTQILHLRVSLGIIFDQNITFVYYVDIIRAISSYFILSQLDITPSTHVSVKLLNPDNSWFKMAAPS